MLMYRKKTYLLLFLLLLCRCIVHAAPIDSLEAERVAKAFLVGQRQTKQVGTAPSVQLTLQEKNEAAYLFSSPDGRFVLTAADDALPSVLGYGKDADGEMPSALQQLMLQYGQSLASANHRLAERSLRNSEPVAPLLSAVRHQRAPFNGACPYYIHSNGTLSEERCVVGCVATALEEVISYYRRTVVLLDTLHGWSTKHYDIPDVLPGTSVDTRLILDRYEAGAYTEAEADAVARLSYYCGVAAKMNWGLGESGASIYRLVEPLKRAFGYGYVHYLDSYQYTPSDWWQLMEREVRNGRPVLYAGYLMQMGGHAFVIDGLDADGYFHLNWGYSGHYDGYFLLDVLNAFEPKTDTTEEGLTNGFFCNHQALLLHPDAQTDVLPDTLSRDGSEVVVDSVRFLQQPETGKFTELLLHLRNTSLQPLTTPFELFTNAPSDTAVFRQADFVALTGTTMQPGEQRTVKVHAKFNKAGERLFGVSPDDVRVLFQAPVSVAEGKTVQPAYGAPLLNFPDAGTLFVQLPIDNSASVGRLGHYLTYELLEGEYDAAKEGTRHAHYLYTPAGEETMDTVSFKALTPGATYTLLVRQPWTIHRQVTFTLPAPSAIEEVVAEEQKPTQWFAPDGRAIAAPSQKGLYLRRAGNRTEKIFMR